MRNKVESQSRSVNVVMKDGSARRLPRDRAEELLRSGAAKRFISNTVYKALSLGIEVKDLSTLDKNGSLKKQVRDRSEKRSKSRKDEAESETKEQTEEAMR